MADPIDARCTESAKDFLAARDARISAHADEVAKQEAYFAAEDARRKADDRFALAQGALLGVIEEACELPSDAMAHAAPPVVVAEAAADDEPEPQAIDPAAADAAIETAVEEA